MKLVYSYTCVDCLNCFHSDLFDGEHRCEVNNDWFDDNDMIKEYLNCKYDKRKIKRGEKKMEKFEFMHDYNSASQELYPVFQEIEQYLQQQCTFNVQLKKDKTIQKKFNNLISKKLNKFIITQQSYNDANNLMLDKITERLNNLEKEDNKVRLIKENETIRRLKEDNDIAERINHNLRKNLQKYHNLKLYDEREKLYNNVNLLRMKSAKVHKKKQNLLNWNKNCHNIILKLKEDNERLRKRLHIESKAQKKLIVKNESLELVKALDETRTLCNQKDAYIQKLTAEIERLNFKNM